MDGADLPNYQHYCHGQELVKEILHQNIVTCLTCAMNAYHLHRQVRSKTKWLMFLN
jgi:hypothetical protein